MHTALRLNDVIHKYYDVVFVLSDSAYRSKLIRVAGEKVKFVKVKPSLVGFGLVKRSGLYSEFVQFIVEKTGLNKSQLIEKDVLLHSLLHRLTEDNEFREGYLFKGSSA